MRVLKFIVDKQTIKPDPTCNFEGLVKGSSGYLKASFSFSPEWNSCKVAASFWKMDSEYPVLLQNNQCQIPAEALAGNFVGISVTGIKDNGNFVITSNKIIISQRG